MRVYLDKCCLSRPFDDQSLPRNRVESEAVLAILDEIDAGRHELVDSEALQIEIRQDPSSERQDQIRAHLSLSSDFVQATSPVRSRAVAFAALGFGAMDALHLACAEAGGCDVFLTTDDRLLRRAVLNQGVIGVRARNPAKWLLNPLA